MLREDLETYSTGDKRFIDRIREAYYRKHRVVLADVLSKPALARRLIETRLREIHDEVTKDRYKPKLELEKVLSQVYSEIFHAPVL